MKFSVESSTNGGIAGVAFVPNESVERVALDQWASTVRPAGQTVQRHEVGDDLPQWSYRVFKVSVDVYVTEVVDCIGCKPSVRLIEFKT